MARIRNKTKVGKGGRRARRRVGIIFSNEGHDVPKTPADDKWLDWKPGEKSPYATEKPAE